MKNKKVIYTAVFSGYDKLRNPRVHSSEWDYVCFTDMDLESHIWDIRKVDLTGPLASRDVKINSHKWLPEYDEWFYMDAGITTGQHFTIQTEYEWLGFKHRCPDPWQEYSRIIELGKGDVNILNKQLYDYAGEGVPLLKGHMSGGVLFRKNTENVKAMNEAWYLEYTKYPSRDQVGLYKVIHNTDCKWSYLDGFIDKNRFDQEPHLKALSKRTEGGNIYEFTPSGIGPNFRDYGTVLNNHCALVPYDEDWIIIRDQDTMYFPGRHREIIREATLRFPDTGIFGAYTNRIGLKWQLHGDKASDDPNIMNHYEISRKRQEDFGSDIEEVNQPIAGFFMMFRKGTWRNTRFEEGDMSDSNTIFDWDFSQKVLSMKKPTRLIKGLYLFHFYRFQQDDIRNCDHIFV